MQEPSLVQTLSENNYFLMTNEEGNEVYDDDGNLLLYQAEGGQCLSVPNTEEVRRLYDLPLETPETKDTIKRKDVYKPGNLLCIQDDGNQIVWLGQKNQRSTQATKKLIELFNSPKYQAMMKNKNMVRLKIWEQIAGEIEASGFKIATNTREAGLRTFQKWRNLERAYWKYLKMNPEECGDEKRRKKPYFFDEMHAVLSKRSKESSLDSSLFSHDSAMYRHEEADEDEDIDVEFSPRFETEPIKRVKRFSDIYGSDCEAFPREALSLLTSLVTSPKYDQLLKDHPQKSTMNKVKIWESIYMDMMKEGWRFGETVRDGALILCEKWRMVEKAILRKRLCGPRTLYTPTFRKAMLIEIEKRKALGPNYERDTQSPSDFPNPCYRRPKIGEIEPEVVEALLKVIASGCYQIGSASSEGRRNKVWERIFDEVQSQGFDIAGKSKREKITRMFQKWRNMKRSFVKYQIAKFKGREMKKPMFYELMFNIISNDLLNSSNYSECDSDDEERTNENEWDEESESEYPPDLLELSNGDHDYGQSSVGNNDSNDGYMPISMDVEQVIPVVEIKQAGTSSLEPKPSTSRTSRSYQVLKQIKSLHETTLAMQQQSFAKIISLLETQISEQNKLTSVISEYIKCQTVKSGSKNGQRTEHLNHT